MNISKVKITDELVIARMESPDGITVHRLSQRLGASDERVRAKLLELIRHGKVRRERESKSQSSFYRYFVVGAENVIAGGEFEVAAPLIPIRLDTDLNGYEAEFARRQSLCMTLRRAA